MSTEGYGVTVTINSHASCDFVADTYDAAAATLLNALRVSPQDAAATSEIVDIVDDRIVVHDEGTVAELLAWATGTPRR